MIKVKYMKELPKAYDPKEVEDKIYDFWQKSGFFNPDKLPGKRTKSYSMVIPPPNVTGELHMGHALNTTIQDILARKKRMEGLKVLWIPGTDHAGIATQNVVEKQLRKEGLSRFDLGREKFVEKVWEWKEKYGNLILNQLKKMGASCDWSRTRFTMDEDYAKSVNEAFLHYYKKGWIYQGKRVINWCPRCQTSLSDLELEYKENKGKLWYIKYPIKNENNFVTVATTRPETMLGDTAVAVNPKDKKYKEIIGKTLILPIQEKEIPIIADRVIDMKFGTGAVKVTPAHDAVDWEIGIRHKLETPVIINERGKMTAESKICDGLSPLECREKVLAELESKGLIEKIEDYDNSNPHCSRCSTLIQPIPSKQWFLKMDELAKEAIAAVKSKKVQFLPKNFEKIYFNWLNNIKDWCISRQLWWGHRIPIEGETDVLDTWFSSALWPFATLGWPNKTKDLKDFYPTNVLSTARDIINLWVARMIFSGREFMKKDPFSVVLIHPTVLTKDGKRMSKSLGTGINPLELCDKYGADATRFGLAWNLTGVQDIHFVEDNIIMGKKFCNKIWNASRFVMMQLPKKQIKLPTKISSSGLSGANKKIITKLEKTITLADKELETYQFGKASRTLYDFFWHDFCDTYIEKAKNQNDQKTKQILLYTLDNSLRMLHPFIPFVTEEIYQILPIANKSKMLMVANWPKK